MGAQASEPGDELHRESVVRVEPATADAIRPLPKALLTQSDFLNEKQPSAHMVYDVYMRSNRPKYRYDEALRKNVPDGYEPVERVSVSLQKSILRHKTIHTSATLWNLATKVTWRMQT